MRKSAVERGHRWRCLNPDIDRSIDADVYQCERQRRKILWLDPAPYRVVDISASDEMVHRVRQSERRIGSSSKRNKAKRAVAMGATT